MMKRLRYLEQAQWWPRSKIEGERSRLLANVVATAFNEVPFYRELFDAAGANPASIGEPDHLRRIPVVTKELLRKAYPGKCCRLTARPTYETCTSGSTGSNFRVLEDYETAGWYRATFLLSLQWAGWKMGERHLQVGMTTKRNLERRLKDACMACEYLAGFDLRDDALDHCLAILDRKRIQHLWGYPGSMFCIARRAQQRGWNTPLKSAVTWGDQLHAPYRRLIESVFKVKVTDTYGCGEGMQIAAQCGHGPHYHLHELDVVVELLDDSGNPVPSGTPGRIVLTRLHPGPMPFIRYDVGDTGVLTNDTCECGRSFKLLKSIQGRTADYVLARSGNRLIVHFFTGILEHFKEIESFQVRQDRPGIMRLCIVPAAGYGPDVEREIRRRLQDHGADLEILIEVVAAIPLTPGGKRRFIIRTVENESRVEMQEPAAH